MQLTDGARTAPGGADLAHIDTWIFDLDNTLYPSSSRLFDQVSQRIGDYIATAFDVDREEAYRAAEGLLPRVRHHAARPHAQARHGPCALSRLRARHRSLADRAERCAGGGAGPVARPQAGLHQRRRPLRQAGDGAARDRPPLQRDLRHRGGRLGAEALSRGLRPARGRPRCGAHARHLLRGHPAQPGAGRSARHGHRLGAQRQRLGIVPRRPDHARLRDRRPSRLARASRCRQRWRTAPAV